MHKNTNAMIGLSVGDLEDKIDDMGGLYDSVVGVDSSSGRTQVMDDVLSRVKVDFENLEYASEYGLPGAEDLDQFEMVGSEDGKFPVAWVAVGGDWEKPLVFAMYMDKGGDLRAYVPEDGNAYNHEFNCAYGSEPHSSEVFGQDDEDEDESMEVDASDDDWVFDSQEMREEVGSEISVG